jgi:hypothetical protein
MQMPPGGISKKIVALNDDIADMYPDAEPHLFTGMSIRILFGYGVLNLDSTLHGIHGAGEIGDEAVPSSTKDPTPM